MIRNTPSRWRTAVLVCAKCEKKLGKRGFGEKGRERLSKLLRKGAGGKGRKAGYGVIESRCLKVCPKQAVTVVDAAHPGRWLVVPAGAAVEEVTAALGLGDEIGGAVQHRSPEQAGRQLRLDQTVK